MTHLLSHELAESSKHGGGGGGGASSREHTPNSRRQLILEEREEGRGTEEAQVEASLDSQFEGFESRPSSRVVMKDNSDPTNDNLQKELAQQEHSQKESHDSHVTTSGHTDTALSHLTNDILTYSNQVAMTTAGNMATQSSWLPPRDDALRPSSPMAVNRVFKVIFLGESRSNPAATWHGTPPLHPLSISTPLFHVS